MCKKHMHAEMILQNKKLCIYRHEQFATIDTNKNRLHVYGCVWCTLFNMARHKQNKVL